MQDAQRPEEEAGNQARPVTMQDAQRPEEEAGRDFPTRRSNA